jgi:hypothetical protein
VKHYFLQFITAALPPGIDVETITAYGPNETSQGRYIKKEEDKRLPKRKGIVEAPIGGGTESIRCDRQQFQLHNNSLSSSLLMSKYPNERC